MFLTCLFKNIYTPLYDEEGDIVAPLRGFQIDNYHSCNVL